MRQTLQNLFGFELSTGLRWIIAFAIVLVLVGLFAFLLRRITGGRLKFAGPGGGRTRQPRLGVIDIHDLDRQRQLILVRRDNVEHLIMIGGASDVVIETNIVRSGARVAASHQGEHPAERPLAFDPMAETIRPEPPRQDSQDEPRRAPSPPVPPVQPEPPAPVASVAPPVPEPQPRAPQPPVPPLVQASSQPPLPRPAGQGIPQRQATVAAATIVAASGPAFTRDAAPAPSASSGELDDMARQLEEALKRPFSAVRPSQAPAAQAPVAQAPAADLPPVQPAPIARPPREDAAPAAPVPPAPAAPPLPPLKPTGRSEPRPPAEAAPKPTASSLLDMEAELEMALGLKPGPSAPPPPEPALVVPAEVKRPPEPAKPAAGKFQIPGFGAPRAEAAKPDGDKAEVVTSEPESRKADPRKREPATVEPVIIEPVIVPAAEVIEPSKPDPADPVVKAEAPVIIEATANEAGTAGHADEKAAGAAPKDDTVDPFSVDAIEAEFARLLGRDPKGKA